MGIEIKYTLRCGNMGCSKKMQRMVMSSAYTDGNFLELVKCYGWKQDGDKWECPACQAEKELADKLHSCRNCGSATDSQMGYECECDCPKISFIYVNFPVIDCPYWKTDGSYKEPKPKEPEKSWKMALFRKGRTK